MHFVTYNMSTSTRIMRSKGESDGLSLPTRTRPTRKDTTLGRNGGMVLNTPGNTGQDQQQQMPTQTPHLTQSPQATSAERTEATTPMLPPGPHRPLMPHMPLPTSPTSSSWSSAPLFKENKYSSTSEEESEADAEVTFIHSRSNGTFANHQADAKSLKLVFSSSYAGCFLPCLLVLLFLRVGSLHLFWGMFVRGCARRDLC